MTVRELIRELHIFNLDAEVIFSDQDTNPMVFCYTQGHFPSEAVMPLVIINLQLKDVEEYDDAN